MSGGMLRGTLSPVSRALYTNSYEGVWSWEREQVRSIYCFARHTLTRVYPTCRSISTNSVVERHPEPPLIFFELDSKASYTFDPEEFPSMPDNKYKTQTIPVRF